MKPHTPWSGALSRMLGRGRSAARVFALALLAGAGAGAAAQSVPPAHELVPYVHFSPQGLTAAGAGVVASHELHLPGAAWLRLRFGEVRLPPGARLRLSSPADGARQHLDARTLAQWRHTSAYFNGDTLRVELLAARAGEAGHFSLVEVVAGRPQVSPESRCGPTDDRVRSQRKDRARLLDVGCSTDLTAHDCLITAGHCLSPATLVDVVQFNVPASRPDGSLVHPGPEDQYVPTENRQFVAGGIGNDWGVFTVFPNSETGLTPLQAQGAWVRFSRTLPVVGDEVRIAGYGIDDGVDNQTQQVASGPVESVDAEATILGYRADTEPGNSGSAVVVGGRVVAIHTHGGCTDAGGSNKGTLVANEGFRQAYREVCLGGRAGTAGVDFR